MLKRSLFFSQPWRLSYKNKQLVATNKEDGEVKTVPVEDLAFVLLDNQRISVSMPLTEALVNNNVAVVYCDAKHHPKAMLLNLDAHHLQNEVFRQQINGSMPLKKNLWKQTIEAKIRNQACLLKLKDKKSKDIERLAGMVKSGDPDNREGMAARMYWPRLMGEGFSRDRYSAPPNNMLNYGYIILRAAVARALVGSGLLPTLGIHHHSRYNAYCLADDIMEPYRPFVDNVVFNMHRQDPEVEILEKEHKAALLQVLSSDVKFGDKRRPLMVALSYTTASLAECFAGNLKKIKYPGFYV
ncbi:MAG: type II CRISPR-associated endonuclease Cas1 [Bacteroidales bacterium]